MTEPHDRVKIGLLSVSDRASAGVYEDKGIPALQAWLQACAAQPDRVGRAPDPRRRRRHRRGADRTGRPPPLPPGADHRRHRPGAARRHARGDAGGGRQGDAGLRRADAPDQPELRADGDPVAPGGGDPQAMPDHQPAGAAEVDRRDARGAAIGVAAGAGHLCRRALLHRPDRRALSRDRRVGVQGVSAEVCCAAVFPGGWADDRAKRPPAPARAESRTARKHFPGSPAPA